MTRAQVIAVAGLAVVLLGLVWCRHAACGEPTWLDEGAPAPHAGVLLEAEDAAKLVADLGAARALAGLRARELGECRQARQVEAAEVITVEVPVQVPVDRPVEVAPWWTWPAVGLGLVLGAALGGLVL